MKLRVTPKTLGPALTGTRVELIISDDTVTPTDPKKLKAALAAWEKESKEKRE